MARKKNRKLFPMLASETNNKTLDCSIGICDTICPYNCYSEPDYHNISPHIPPWSSPRSIRTPSPSISTVHQPSQNDSSSIGVITIITVTGAALAILLTGFFLVANFVSKSVNRVNHGGYPPQRDGDYTVDEDLQDREQVDHPIWFIRTTGLQQSIINSITICNYKRGDGLIERTDCPVCLNEFEEDESLRLLPKCNHAFHISCIDTWLGSHTNCPLCRAGIAISVVTPRVSGPVDVTSGGSGSRLENDEEEQIESRGELGRESDESRFKETLSSSYRDSYNTEPNSDVRIEVIDGDGSETESREKVRVFEECMDPNCGDSIDSLSSAKTHEENLDFPGKSGESSGEASEDTEKVQSDISSNTSKTTGSSSVSFFNTNKSSVFPMSLKDKSKDSVSVRTNGTNGFLAGGDKYFAGMLAPPSPRYQ
ncbi:unnamed protein product [Arabis nemorensis]|uniref:RING-type E3 ubiquitin transferase n=1 Tax=Arabis nemorensis TaxID=586526 RepID=A0A565BM44_9BRAS|nr:unnamed protein product [Arabis nemorensis]